MLRGRRVIGIIGRVGIASLCLTMGTVWAAPETSPAMGTIRAECDRFRVTALVGGAPREIVGEGGSARVPAGSYFILASETEFTDKAGRTWRVRNGMVAMPVVVVAGETKELDLGAPLEARLRPRIEGGQLIAEVQLWGPLGDKCDGVVVEGGALPAPRVRILDESSRLLGRPEGGFCCKFTGMVVWPLPAGVTGRLRLVPEITLGPLTVWSEEAATIEVGVGR
jgi:hypothetical protein